MTLQEILVKVDTAYPEFKKDEERFDGYSRIVIKDGSEFHVENSYLTFVEEWVVLFSAAQRPMVFLLEEVVHYSREEYTFKDQC